MRKTMIAGLAALLPLAAHAGDGPPRYDPAAYCGRVAETGGGSEMIRQGCLENEQDSYDAIKADWAETPPAARSYCGRVAETGGESYMILKGCLDNEARAAGEGGEFEFRY